MPQSRARRAVPGPSRRLGRLRRPVLVALPEQEDHGEHRQSDRQQGCRHGELPSFGRAFDASPPLIVAPLHPTPLRGKPLFTAAAGCPRGGGGPDLGVGGSRGGIDGQACGTGAYQGNRPGRSLSPRTGAAMWPPMAEPARIPEHLRRARWERWSTYSDECGSFVYAGAASAGPGDSRSRRTWSEVARSRARMRDLGLRPEGLPHSLAPLSRSRGGARTSLSGASTRSR